MLARSLRRRCKSRWLSCMILAIMVNQLEGEAMRLQKGQNPNRPKPGSRIKVEPIRTKKAIEIIKRSLYEKPRDLCLFTLGINTAYRANELLSITVGQVRHLQVGHALALKQSKTQTYRMV